MNHVSCPSIKEGKQYLNHCRSLLIRMFCLFVFFPSTTLDAGLNFLQTEAKFSNAAGD